MTFVSHDTAERFLPTLDDGSVRLVLTDPPYYGIVGEGWDNAWKSPQDFADWLASVLLLALPKLTDDGSVVFFAALGRHGEHPLFDVVRSLESSGYTFRNWVTWRKRRAYGKSHDYLYCREEILWFSKSAERTRVVFHKPYTSELRGYEGFDPKYKAHSQYKRASNVWTDIDPVVDDIAELLRPARVCQKPPRLMRRLIETHSDPGDLIVDPFAGYGSTGIEAVALGRRFAGCEAIESDALAADARVRAAKGLT